MPLKVSDGIGAWIKDFQKSDAPQFKGKSEKERRDQAIAAYLSAKRDDKNENVKSADRKPEIYTKPDGKRGVRMVATDRDIVKTEAAPKPLNRSDHTHTVDIAGEGKYRVKAKSMDHAKKLAFKKAGISKLHGHPTMEPKTRIYGEGINENISKMKDSHVKFFATKNISHPAYTRSEIDDEHRRRQRVVPNYHKVKPSMNEDINEATGPADKVQFHMTRADDHKRHAKRHGLYDDEKNQYARMDHEDAAEAHKDAAGALKKHGATSHQFKKAFNHATNLTKNAKYSSAKAGKKLVMSYGESVNEETNFAVNIEGLPMMFMSAMGPGELKQKLRKIVKQPSMIQSVKRVTDADVKKTFRLKAQGRDEEEQMDEAKLDELSPATMNRYKRKASDDLYKSTSKYSSILSKPKTKKDREALDKHIDKRKVGLNLATKRSGTAGYQDESK